MPRKGLREQESCCRTCGCLFGPAVFPAISDQCSGNHAGECCNDFFDSEDAGSEHGRDIYKTRACVACLKRRESWGNITTLAKWADSDHFLESLSQEVKRDDEKRGGKKLTIARLQSETSAEKFLDELGSIMQEQQIGCATHAVRVAKIVFKGAMDIPVVCNIARLVVNGLFFLTELEEKSVPVDQVIRILWQFMGMMRFIAKLPRAFEELAHQDCLCIVRKMATLINILQDFRDCIEKLKKDMKQGTWLSRIFRVVRGDATSPNDLLKIARHISALSVILKDDCTTAMKINSVMQKAVLQRHFSDLERFPSFAILERFPDCSMASAFCPILETYVEAQIQEYMRNHLNATFKQAVERLEKDPKAITALAIAADVGPEEFKAIASGDMVDVFGDQAVEIASTYPHQLEQGQTQIKANAEVARRRHSEDTIKIWRDQPLNMDDTAQSLHSQFSHIQMQNGAQVNLLLAQEAMCANDSTTLKEIKMKMEEACKQTEDIAMAKVKCLVDYASDKNADAAVDVLKHLPVHQVMKEAAEDDWHEKYSKRLDILAPKDLVRDPSGELRVRFQKMDLNNDGVLSPDELHEGLRGLYDQDKIQDVFTRMDVDKNREITFEERVHYWFCDEHECDPFFIKELIDNDLKDAVLVLVKAGYKSLAKFLEIEFESEVPRWGLTNPIQRGLRRYLDKKREFLTCVPPTPPPRPLPLANAHQRSASLFRQLEHAANGLGNPMAKLEWDANQGGRFRSTTGKKLWKEKADYVLPGGIDQNKLDVVFFLAVPCEWINNAAQVPGRELIRIIKQAMLWEPEPADGYCYLKTKFIKRVYILKQGAELVVDTAVGDAGDIWPENVSRCTKEEMQGLWDAAINNIKHSETLVLHFTSLESCKLILSKKSHGLRASKVGQGGGGVSVVYAGI